mmetsp:Transcript_343/g.1066  ORF Transcript_343/g.1066 Transcript_343/m.1066 type:complete len:413 (-) Transcript_343:802-2040(-)
MASIKFTVARSSQPARGIFGAISFFFSPTKTLTIQLSSARICSKLSSVISACSTVSSNNDSLQSGHTDLVYACERRTNCDKSDTPSEFSSMTRRSLCVFIENSRSRNTISSRKGFKRDSIIARNGRKTVCFTNASTSLPCSGSVHACASSATICAAMESTSSAVNPEDGGGADGGSISLALGRGASPSFIEACGELARSSSIGAALSAAISERSDVFSSCAPAAAAAFNWAIFCCKSRDTKPIYKSSTSVDAATSVMAFGKRISLGRRCLPRTRAVKPSTRAGDKSLAISSRTRDINASHLVSSSSPSAVCSRVSPSFCNSSIASPISVVAKMSSAFGSNKAIHAANNGALCTHENTSSHSSIVTRVGSTFTNNVNNHWLLIIAAMISSAANAATCNPTAGKCSRNNCENTR